MTVRHTAHSLSLWGGVAAGAATLALLTAGFGLPVAAGWTAAVTVVCAVWWVTEPVPVPITSLLPFVVLPAADVLDSSDLAAAYGHPLILLLMGGFMLSSAVERSGAHRRMALGMGRFVGRRGARGLVLGLMAATALSSMWISNTATTLMLLPVAIAILEEAKRRGEDEALRIPLLLGIAYSASIGGMATPVGTPPNVIFMGAYEEATGTTMSFGQWMMHGLPVAAILLPLTWLWLVRKLPTSQARYALPELPAMSTREKRVLGIVGLTALAWTTRTGPAGGWAGLVEMPAVSDSTIALAAVLALAITPSGEPTEASTERPSRLLSWEEARQIPWGLLLLFGGGLAIAKAFQSSGLATATGDFLANDLGIAAWPTLLMVAAIALVVTFLTEVTSNTATTTLLMPILAATAAASEVAPAALMLPATLSASCAFMLPVATAPNAIVFGSGFVRTREMAREGIIINLLGALVVTTLTVLL